MATIIEVLPSLPTGRRTGGQNHISKNNAHDPEKKVKNRGRDVLQISYSMPY